MESRLMVGNGVGLTAFQCQFPKYGVGDPQGPIPCASKDMCWATGY